MKHTLLIAATATALLAGCASTTEQTAPAATNVDARFTDCTLPTLADDRGPIRPSLFVVGTFPEGQWIHLDSHKMGYKGDGLYQVVVDEKAGNVSLQFATMSWTPQFTASGMAMTVGQLNELKRGGFAKNTVVNIPKDGKYVWTIQIAADKTPLLAMISECQ
ncbi:glycosidase [Vibrio cholerae]|nr:glycosidase [Vibrio cholerae]